ncbi:glutathione import ATP-binding protein GsiA [Oxobacter pfennigii]|uniref:Glutathione import ATP-binding protein GsiA n=1 Tax=Oxobacter pfennigii TaxID=36849 RepID=A0A0P8W4C9_9CLOT|nr:ABC transporter ATP-binding protein [Oxobacter pfennigii]KPU42545.1 glutathione import ATP-binding protein GsiA [Oxobacter pfennigii]
MGAYFEIKKLKVLYRTFEKEHTVLDIENICIDKGKTYGIVGESGAGKTILALTILGLLQCPPGKIESGEVFFDGENLLKKKYGEMAANYRGKRIAMIFQDPMSTLNPVFTIGYQMIQTVKQNQRLGESKAREKVLEIIETVKLPDAEDIINKYPHQLSGGQRQRIIIAMALLCGAEFLIADEPTRNLDVTIQASILMLLKELQEKLKVTVLFIANNLSLVSAFCDEIGILHNGKIVEQGFAGDILKAPSHEYTKTLIASVTKGSSLANRAFENKDVLLEVKSLKKYFPVKRKSKKGEKLFVKAVDDIDLKIFKGEVVGIVGESGCGKSTLVNTILNLYEPTSGDVIFDGKNIFKLDKRELKKTRKDIQIVFQDPYWSLNPRWLVKDIISEPVKVHERLNGKGLLKRVEELLELVGLSKDSAFKYPHEFSGGQRQRIAIARALAVNPRLVVLDEPTSSIDIVSQSQILELLQDLRRRLGLTNILISHDLSVVNYMADKIIIMYLGKIVEYGDAGEVFKNPLHPYTKALFNSIPTLSSNGMNSLVTLEGNVPSAINPPPGCRFHTRCSRAMEKCSREEPCITNQGKNHSLSCFLYE